MSYENDKDDTRECEAMRKMFVGGLSRSTQEDAFYELFAQFGDIVDKVIITDPHTHESRGFGFVTYSSSQSVENAFKGRPHALDGKPLDIKRAMPREYNTAGAHAKTKKLFIGGLGPDVTPEQLRTYIETRHPTTCGRLDKIDFVKDKITSKNKGFGFLECTDNDFADRLAISENSFTLNRKTMSIKKAEPKEGQDDFNPRGDRGGRGGGRGRGRGGDRGGRGSSRGGGGGGGGRRGGYDGGYGGGGNGYDTYAGGEQSYSTAYPSQGGGGGYSSGGYNPGQSGGYNQGGNDSYGQTAGGGGYSSGGGGGGYASGGGGYGSGGGGGGGAGGGGYSSGGGGAGGGAGGYSSGGGYASTGYSQGAADSGYSQGGGYGSAGRGGGRGGAPRGGRGGGGGGGGQRYQPY